MGRTGLIVIFCAFTAMCSVRADTPEVVVGATLPLTGKLSFIGVSVERALRQACDEVNSRGELCIRLEIEDNNGEPSAAVSSVNHLVLKGSFIVLSPFTHITQAVAPIVERNGRMLLYWAGINRIAEHNPMAFKDWGDAPNDGILNSSTVSLSWANQDSGCLRPVVSGCHKRPSEPHAERNLF